MNPALRDTLVSRTKIIRFLRSFLEERDFMEVETPILGNSVGKVIGRSGKGDRTEWERR